MGDSLSPPCERWITIFIVILLSNADFVSVSGEHATLTNPNQRFDGWYNNLDHVEWGSPGQSMSRLTSPSYRDGVHIVQDEEEGLPNPRTISTMFLRERGRPEALTGSRSVFFAFMGQLIADDMADSRRIACPNEYLNVVIPENDNANSTGLSVAERIIPIYRSKYDPSSGTSSNKPRALLNEATAWLDGSSIYGNSRSWSEHLRSFEDGKLRVESEESNVPAYNRYEIPLINPIVDQTRPPQRRSPDQLFSFGNPRGNENPFLMTIGIIWFRYHNYIANQRRAENPDWSDEQIFESTRRWVIAVYQKVVAYEWLPMMIGKDLPPYEGYNAHLDPSVSVEFSVAAMRVGHSLVPSGVVLYRNNCSKIDPLPKEYGASTGEPALRLCNTYWQLQDALFKNGIEPLVLGMALQKAENDDNKVVEDLADFLYGPLQRTRLDLETLTIERGRDAGLSSYNVARTTFGLESITDFSDLNPGMSQDMIMKLREVYNNNTDLLELYVGGMLEPRAKANATGELFAEVILEQMERTRNSDRFWFENLSNTTEIELVRRTTMRDVILSVTTLEPDTLQTNVFNIAEGSRCYDPMQAPIQFNKPCTPNTGIHFFEGYWGKFAGILILIVLFPTVAYFAMCIIAWKRQYDLAIIKKSVADAAARKASKKKSNKVVKSDGEAFSAFEVEGGDKSRRVVVAFEEDTIKILNVSGALLRSISMSSFKKSYLFTSRNKRKDLMVIRIPKEYDVVLRFVNNEERTSALKCVQEFMQDNSIQVEVFEMDETALKIEAVTKEARQTLLEAFFRRVFAEVLNLDDASVIEDNAKTLEVATIELTRNEVAETMGMKSDSLFVQQIFQLADVDKSGYLSFREFVDLIILLMNGTPEQKAKMLFDMYDTDHSGEINRQEANVMIRSFLEMGGVNLVKDEIDAAVDSIFRETGMDNKEAITLEDFQYVMLKEHRDSFAKAQLSLPGVTKSIRRKVVQSQTHKAGPVLKRQITQMKDSESSDGGSAESTLRKRTINGDAPERPVEDTNAKFEAVVEHEEKSRLKRLWKTIKRTVENYRQHIFCMVIFYSITIVLMIERATFYAFGTEHSGIRRVTEWGIIISRSTAAAISFQFSFILLTMCRNLITFCRETFLKKFIPFDAAVAFHKQIAYVALILTILHAFGHLVNFYHFSVHPLPVLACLFPRLLVDDGSDLPHTISWWFFETVTGVTGLLLLLTIAVIYIFALQFSRRYCFRAFWITHHLYSLLYVLIILHGSMEVVQSPKFHFYLVVPLVIFCADKFITISRSKVKIPVVKVDPLPSDVLNLVFKRPTAFDYRSGQWVRIACLPLSSNEYHPFTLTSAPHERYLSLHIRSVGPWTTNLRNLYKSALEGNEKLPELYLDGPFGEGHQDWYKYEVSVLVGAGIGVTPFASIIKDIVNRSTSKKGFQITCKKVYFIWVTRTQRHFEWLTDIIRELEETQGGHLVSTHIYITQFSNKFDLRTTMLYICERYFQKVASKSMFTGLKAITHFGRPQFELFFDTIQTMHSDVRTVGVFSCGPPGVTNGVDEACNTLNKMNKARFNHFFENF